MEESARLKIIEELRPRKFGKNGTIWATVLVLLCLAGIIAYADQLRRGLIITNMGDYASWGIYISNFVFFFL